MKLIILNICQQFFSVLVESQISFKTQLQIYAQKNSVALPKYDAVFKANVTVAGQTFYSQQLFSTLEEAESDAAKVALSSLSLGENQNPQASFEHIHAILTT